MADVNTNPFNAAYFAAGIQQLFPAKMFLRKLFAKVLSINSLTVDWDFYENTRKLANFTSLRVQGDNLPNLVYKTKQVDLPTIKQKHFIADADIAQSREFGYHRYAEVDFMEKTSLRILREMYEDLNSISRLEEWCLAQAIQTGIIPIVGTGISTSVDMGMKNTHIYSLTGNDLWSDSSSDPLRDLRNACDLIADDSGLSTGFVAICGNDAITALQNNSKFKEALDNRRIELAKIDPSLSEDGSVLVGTISDPPVALYRYPEKYYNGSALVPMISPKKVVLASTLADVTIYYGGIYSTAFTKDGESAAVVDTTVQDNTFGRKAIIKTRNAFDPSGTEILVQTSSLPVVRQPDGFICMQVLA
jgi:hypothetical protein